jgi:hypothetical protein
MVLGFNSVLAQLELKLQLIEDDKWGVYVRANGVTPSTTTITGSGQVTLVVPTGFTYANLTSVKGTWLENARVNAPPENSSRDYISFGLINDSPQIIYSDTSETLLFTFNRVGACPDTLHLIDVNDPFEPNNIPPTFQNSANSNPGNDLSVVDFGVVPTAFYNYSGNYALSAWSCHDCDGDGILNGLEDTNGNGTFDPGIDSSALCDPCDPYHPESASLEFATGLDTICANDLGDTAYLVVNIVGGWPPYIVRYTDGTDTTTVGPLYSGDSIQVVPTTSVTYDLIDIVDSFGCLLDTALTGGVNITVEGPISITDHPDDVVECSDHSTSFFATAANAGDGVIRYQWQVSSDGGVTYTDITNGTPYSTATTATLNISQVAGLHNYRYRVKIWTPSCDTVYSNAALLQVEGPITVTTHPSNITICDTEDNASFTAAANNAGAVGTLMYQWQVNTGSGWVDVSNGALYSNVTTTTVNLTAPTVSMDGWQYRMKIFTGQCDTIYTNAAVLNIEGPLTFTDQPDNVSNCAGSEVFFYYQYTNPGGGNVNFQWQQSCDGGVTWTNLNNVAPYNNAQGVSLGTTGDTLAITNVIGLDGCQYRVRIRTATCSNVTSNAATLSVSGNVTFSDDPDDITVCSSADTIFVATASIPQGTFTWGWQYSTDGGTTWSNITLPSGVYSHTGTAAVAAGSDTLQISDVSGMYNYRFRAVAYATDCDSVVSKEARLLIEGPLSVSDHPDDITSCSGEDPVTFSATIDNPGVSGSTIYRWQTSLDGGATWINLSNAGVYNGTGTTTLSIANTSGLNGRRFRLSATTSTCSMIFTNSATLFVEGPLTVATQPSDVRLCTGQSTSFTSTFNNGTGVGTITYQWQVSTDLGLNWSNLTNSGVYSNVTTTTLNISDATGLYGRCYRLRATTDYCSAVFSNRACLTVEGPLAITDQPDTVTQCSGEPVIFAVGVTNSSPDDPGGILYQWQESTDNGATWTNLPNDAIYNGTGTDTMSIAITTGKDNNLYRVLTWTSTCDTTISDVALLQIEGPLTFTDDPDNVTQCSGSGVTFQVTTANAGLGTVLYQWERSCDNGATWSDVANGGVYSGATTTSLVISDVAGLDSCRFRVRQYTATCNAVYSNYAVVTVEGPISFVTQPANVTECSGLGTSFSVETANTGSGQITYQWQISLNNGGTWFNLSNNSIYNGVKSSTLSISDVAGLNGRCYRVLIQTSTCSSVASDMACLAVEGPIFITDHPDDITQCSAEGVIFVAEDSIVTGNVGTITRQWQVSSDGGLNWSNLTNAGVYSGVTDDTLTISNVAGLNGRRYRICSRTTECSAVYSNPALLTVEGPLSINLNGHPDDVTTCSDKEVIFHTQMTNPGQGAIQYIWQQSIDGGTTWTNLDNTPPYNGTKSDTLSISPVAGLNNTLYRVKAWSSTCDTITTNSALLLVEGPLTFTDEPDDVTLCSTSPTSFTVAVNNLNGIGTMTYQWQVSVTSGVWSNLSNTAPYSGVNTNTLNISNTAGLGGRKYRCFVATQYCDSEYSNSATLNVEGPITIDTDATDASVCNNIGHIFVTEVSNPGSGALQFQWQVSSNGGSSWANLTNNQLTGFSYYGVPGKYTGVKTEELNISLVDGLDGYMYRMLIRTSTCFDTTFEATLTVLDACTTGTCDFDLDGDDNDTDLDDDDDQLTDVWEDWINLHNTLDGWNYLDNTGNLLNYSNCSIDSDGDGILDNQEDPDGDLINNGEETDSDGTFDGNPLDPCDPILGPTCVGINLAIRMYLQGGLIGATPDTLMRDDLRKRGLIPLEEPYTDYDGDPHDNVTVEYFTHTGLDGGGETITDSAGVLGVTGPDAIVDWVFVELRSSTALDSVIATRSALLQRDGDVVDVDGTSYLHFQNANAGAFYVSVRHRNHLGVMTAEALDLSPTVSFIDYTDPAFLTEGAYAQIELGTKMALWAGDLNGNGRTIYQGPGNDIGTLFRNVIKDPGNTSFLANYISTGYLGGDINLDGKAIYQGPNNDRSMMLFNTILNHPANVNNIANYVILEQLP